MAVFAIFFALALRIRTCESVRLPNYIPTLQLHPGGRNDIVESYFRLGIDYTEILLYLVFFHGITLSLRQLKRVLKAKGLGRRRTPSDAREVCQAVEEELSGSGSNIGYRQMTQLLVNDYGLVVHRETVRELLKILDPEGVELRARRSLKRRQYRTKGPNHLWHIDGYDKLKPFGFCIHGAIDGFSRRILWLDVGPTNNDPSVICQYFIDCVRQLGGTARVIRADHGTENGYVAAAQRFFRRNAQDDLAEMNSFMTDVDLDELELVEERCCYRTPESGCCDEFAQLVGIIMEENNLQFPRTAEEATTLYVTLLEEIENI